MGQSWEILLGDTHLQYQISRGLRELEGTYYTFEEGYFLVGQNRHLCVRGLFCETLEKFSET